MADNSMRETDTRFKQAGYICYIQCIFGKKKSYTKSLKHYENTSIQIYRKFHLQNPENFQIKNADIFYISAQNIDCGYSLEPPRQGGSNEYP